MIETLKLIAYLWPVFLSAVAAPVWAWRRYRRWRRSREVPYIGYL
jgi:hypothetical protein